MLSPTSLFNSQMSLLSALAVVLVIVALTGAFLAVLHYFTRQTPTRRQALIDLVRAWRGGP